MAEIEHPEKILILGGRVVDPSSGSDETRDVCIEGGRIVDEFSASGSPSEIDATGLIVTPGLVDMHVHLREPGREDEETVATGAEAAAAGGFSTIVAMPNTDPPVDNRAIAEMVRERGEASLVNVFTVGAITQGLGGERLSDMGELVDAGVVAFSDDGRPVSNSLLMRRAMEYSLAFDLPLIIHAEDLDLSEGGVMNESLTSTKLGLRGIPAAAEEIMIARDIMLARLTGATVHFTHVSTAGGVALIRKAKGEKLNVTADVTPHHLCLDESRLTGFDANQKMNPPLRTAADRDALVEGLIDGTIDAIASDHAPHAAHEKTGEIESAPFGTIGLQTTVPAVFSSLSDRISMIDLIAKMTSGPADILRLKAGTLEPGAAADVTIIDPKAKVEITTDYFLSKSMNSAFIGETLVGCARHLLVAGRLVLSDGKVAR